MGAALVAVVVMSIVSIVGRKLFNAPVPGDVEVLQMFAAFASASFFAYCHLMHGEVKVPLTNFAVLVNALNAGNPDWVNLPAGALNSLNYWQNGDVNIDAWGAFAAAHPGDRRADEALALMEQKRSDHVAFINYEELVTRPEASLMQLAEFFSSALTVPLCSGQAMRNPWWDRSRPCSSSAARPNRSGKSGR